MAVPLVVPSAMATADVLMHEGQEQPFQTYLSLLHSPCLVNCPFPMPHRNSALLERKQNSWKWNEKKKKFLCK